ncbi:MAG TPA: phosphatase PAP2 family protein [Ktedonobacterales bacterium]|nr:phosphatase PAP2 family protein [Ktedonobacterales bacterium]
MKQSPPSSWRRAVNHAKRIAVALVAPSDGRRPLRGFYELSLILVVTCVYCLTWVFDRDREADALENAQQILSLERALHLNLEASLQAMALPHSWLIFAANAFYLLAHLPILLGVGIWLFHKHQYAYRWFRNAFLITAVLGFAVYVILPETPPHYLPGFVDTLKLSGIQVGGSTTNPFDNPFAAMPSLHVGWAVLDGVAMMACARSWYIRAAGLALPLVMNLVVLMTGNHFLLDTLAGAGLALVALGLAAWWSPRAPQSHAARAAIEPSS